MLPACLRGVSDVPTRSWCRCPGAQQWHRPVALSSVPRAGLVGSHSEVLRPQKEAQTCLPRGTGDRGQGRPQGSLWPLPQP